jgi:hypothetical protein
MLLGGPVYRLNLDIYYNNENIHIASTWQALVHLGDLPDVIACLPYSPLAAAGLPTHKAFSWLLPAVLPIHCNDLGHDDVVQGPDSS